MEVFLGCAVMEVSDRSWHDCEQQMASVLCNYWVRGRKNSEVQLQPYKPELHLNPALKSDRAIWICVMIFRNQDSPLPWFSVLSRNVCSASWESNKSCKGEPVPVELNCIGASIFSCEMWSIFVTEKQSFAFLWSYLCFILNRSLIIIKCRLFEF